MQLSPLTCSRNLILVGSVVLALLLPSLTARGQTSPKLKPIRALGMFHSCPDDSYRDRVDLAGSFPVTVNRKKFPSSFPLVSQRYANPFVPNGQWYMVNADNAGRRSTGFMRDTNNAFTRTQQLNGWKKIIDTAARRGVKVLVGGPLYREFCVDAGSVAHQPSTLVNGTLTDAWPDNASDGGVNHEVDIESFRAFLDKITASKNFRATVRGWYLADEPETHCDKSEYDKMYSLIKSHAKARTKPVYVALPPSSYYDSTSGYGKLYNYDGRPSTQLDRKIRYGDFVSHPWISPPPSKGSGQRYMQSHWYREYTDWAPMASRNNRPQDSTAADVILLELYPFGNSTVSLEDWQKAIFNALKLSNIPPENIGAIVQGILGEQPDAEGLRKERDSEKPEGDTVWTYQKHIHSSRHDRRALSGGQIEKQVEYVHALGVTEFYLYAWVAPAVWSEEGDGEGLVVQTADAKHNWNKKGLWEDILGKIVKKWSLSK